MLATSTRRAQEKDARATLEKKKMEKNKFKMEEEGRRWGVSEGVKDVEVGCKGLGVERGGSC